MKRGGFYFVEGMPKTNGVRAGTVDAELWQPYKVWAGDVWACEGCGATIISGVGQRPVSERHHEDFHDVIEKLNAKQFQVNDC